ncbi:hypothetical protein EON80_09535 [bacterium]|nr:MAG: hypothetical protein EON80_09535 [bacterium]
MNISNHVSTSDCPSALSARWGRGVVITDGVLGAIAANRLSSRGGVLRSAEQLKTSTQLLSEAPKLPSTQAVAARAWREAAQFAVRASHPLAGFEMD